MSKTIKIESIEAQNEFLAHWEKNWAVKRLHGTERRQVQAMFEGERAQRSTRNSECPVWPAAHPRAAQRRGSPPDAAAGAGHPAPDLRPASRAHKMDFALWSRAAVMQLIEREYGIKLHVRSVGKYLARWGFTPQKPIKRACEQSPAAVQQWLDTQYPQIAQRAKAAGAEVHWGDVTALVNTDVGAAVLPPKARRRWRWPWAARAKSSR